MNRSRAADAGVHAVDGTPASPDADRRADLRPDVDSRDRQGVYHQGHPHLLGDEWGVYDQGHRSDCGCDQGVYRQGHPSMSGHGDGVYHQGHEYPAV